MLCPSGWICASRRIMATTSQNEAARELVFKLYALAYALVKSETYTAVAGWRESEQGVCTAPLWYRSIEVLHRFVIPA